MVPHTIVCSYMATLMLAGVAYTISLMRSSQLLRQCGANDACVSLEPGPTSQRPATLRLFRVGPGSVRRAMPPRRPIRKLLMKFRQKESERETYIK